MKQQIISLKKQIKIKFKLYATLNYIENFLILASRVTGRVSISAFAFLVSISIGITNSAVRLKIFLTAGIKKYKKNKN